MTRWADGDGWRNDWWAGTWRPTGHVDKHWAIFKLNARKLNMALDRKLVVGTGGRAYPGIENLRIVRSVASRF
jgi:hypothetical protein